MPLMLLRNLSPRQGLCNGIKMIFQGTVNNRLLKCRLIESGKEVLIPRIILLAEPSRRNPFRWARRQFPVRIAFATTINKSQGQTLSTVGVWLRKPVFAHGQLYVACSRTGDPRSLKIALNQQEGHQAANVVYRDVLIV